MSDGRKAMYEDMEHERFEAAKKRFERVPSSKRLEYLEEALDKLQKLYQLDVPMTRKQVFYLEESIELIRRALGLVHG